MYRYCLYGVLLAADSPDWVLDEARPGLLPWLPCSVHPSFPQRFGPSPFVETVLVESIFIPPSVGVFIQPHLWRLWIDSEAISVVFRVLGKAESPFSAIPAQGTTTTFCGCPVGESSPFSSPFVEEFRIIFATLSQLLLAAFRRFPSFFGLGQTPTSWSNP